MEMDGMVGRPMSLGSSEWPMKRTPVTLAGRKGKSLHLARLAALGRKVSVKNPGATLP